MAEIQASFLGQLGTAPRHAEVGNCKALMAQRSKIRGFTPLADRNVMRPYGVSSCAFNLLSIASLGNLFDCLNSPIMGDAGAFVALFIYPDTYFIERKTTEIFLDTDFTGYTVFFGQRN